MAELGRFIFLTVEEGFLYKDLGLHVGVFRCG